MALTVKKVQRALRKGERVMLSDKGGVDGVRGLYLAVHSKNSAHWALRFQLNGRARLMGLGSARDFTLSGAREKARKARQLLHDGVDPLEAKKAERAAQALASAKIMTFKQCADAYIKANQGGWKNEKHRAQWNTTLASYVLPKIGALPVGEVDIGQVLRCIEPIWREKTETASRIRGRIESILDWATVRRYRQGDNPARWSGHLEHVLPAKSKVAKVNHHAALPYRELPAFMAVLRQREGIAARALEFCILTAARTGEVIGATWGEIDFDSKTWTVPAGRMKAGKAHRVPLSEPAIDLLRDLPTEQGNEFIFIGSQQGAGLSTMALTAVLRRMGHGDVTTHGMRSTFRDWCAETTNYPNHVVEMALAHRISDAVEAAYRRGDLFKKREALAEAWSRYCMTPPSEGGKVVALRKGAPA
jgi:integrase